MTRGASDIDSTETGSVSVPANPGIGSVIAIPLAPDEVDKLIHGSYTNYGWLLKMDTENNDRHDYASSSSTTLSNRPKLVIEYSTAADVPEEWTDRTYTYSHDQPHAVIADSTGAAYDYDNNGNMLHREEGGKQYTQSYNAEHQLSQVALWNNQTLLATWNFFYDGDGSRVRQEYFEGTFGQNVMVKVTNYYAGGTYELDQDGVVQANGSILIAGTITRKYYAFAGQTVAMVECSPQGCGAGLKYFLTDHLGSVAAVVNASGGLISQQRYYPYGGIRTDVGTVSQTDFGYTGQRNLDAQGNSYRLGLMDYKARFYDAYLHHFIQPDTLTAGGPQGLNRYAYSINNPTNYTDPSGNMAAECGSQNEDCGGESLDEQLTDYGITTSGLSDAQKMDVILAAGLTGKKIAQSLSAKSDVVGAFKDAIGPITINVAGIANNSGNCMSNHDYVGEINCGLAPDVQNLLHEFGHVFDKRYESNNTIGDTHSASDYLPVSFVNSSAGFVCNTYPCLEHPASDPTLSPPDKNEQFADMFLNWVLNGNSAYPKNGFNDTDEGITWNEWMSSTSKYYTGVGIPVFLSHMGY